MVCGTIETTGAIGITGAIETIGANGTIGTIRTHCHRKSISFSWTPDAVPQKTSCKHHTNSRQLQNGAAFAVRLSVRGVSLVVHLNAPRLRCICPVRLRCATPTSGPFCLSSTCRLFNFGVQLCFILLRSALFSSVLICSHLLSSARPDRFADLGCSRCK